MGPHFGGSGHLVLFLVVLYFIKLQTLPNIIPEGNLIKSMYITPKIALILRLMISLYGPVAYISLFTFSQQEQLQGHLWRDANCLLLCKLY